MDRLLYIAMTGAKEILHAQAVNTHNMVNANTTGFRADLDGLVSRPLQGPGHPSRVYAQDASNGLDLAPGSVARTGRDLDVALRGEGWIAVQAPDGGEAYTRAGDLRTDANGLLTTGTGLPVMGNAGPVAIPPAEKLEIGTDGTISIRPLGQDARTLAVIDRIKLVDPDPARLVKGDDGLIRTRTGAPALPDAGVQLASGSLESSNVNTVEAMVNMLELARHFEVQMKMMQTAKENDEASARLVRLT